MSSNLTGLTNGDFDVVNTDQLFVNGVEITQNGGGGGGGTYVLPLSADGTRGGVQIGYTENDKNYPVELSSEKMFVNVPWENTQLTLTGSDGIDVTNGDELSTKYDSANGDSTTTIYDVGGIPSGTAFSELKSLSLPALIDKMFNPVLVPIKTTASTISSFTNTVPSIVRCGDTYNTNITFNINLGGISYQNGDTINQNNNDYLGEITSGSIVLFGQASASLTVNSSARGFNTYNNTGFTWGEPTGSNTSRAYTSSFTFDVATYTLVDSNGNNFTDSSIPLPAIAQTIGTSGTYRTTAKTTTAVYEFQKGTSSGFESASLTNNPSAFTFSQNFTETESFRHTIYIPSVYITANKEYKIQKLNTVSNNYEDLADTQFNITTVTINVGNLTGVSYQKRAYKGILATAADYKLVRL
jgi:hypothetical protein